VHTAGGVPVAAPEEIGLQCDVKEGDRLFYFTTCGWMMWNWLASGLASGATLPALRRLTVSARGQDPVGVATPSG
jgi:acetoacetyl-CoA synthetase